MCSVQCSWIQMSNCICERQIFFFFFFLSFCLFVEKCKSSYCQLKNASCLIDSLLFVQTWCTSFLFFFTCRIYMWTWTQWHYRLQVYNVRIYHENYAEFWAIVLNAYREMHNIFHVFCRPIFSFLFIQTIRTLRMDKMECQQCDNEKCVFIFFFCYSHIDMHRLQLLQHSCIKIFIENYSIVVFVVSLDFFWLLIHYYWLPREKWSGKWLFEKFITECCCVCTHFTRFLAFDRIWNRKLVNSGGKTNKSGPKVYNV